MQAMQGKLTQEEALTDITGKILTKKLFNNICLLQNYYQLFHQTTNSQTSNTHTIPHLRHPDRSTTTPNV